LPAGAFAHHHASQKRKQAEQRLRDQAAIAAASALHADTMTAVSSSSASSAATSGLSVTLPSLASTPSHLRLVGHAGDPFPLRASWAIGGACGPYIPEGKSQRAVRSCNRVD
jgi:hypothetical protein